MAKKPRFNSRPESRIQARIVDFLGARGWFVRSTHGNAYQSGFPDLFAFHKKYGFRWIDVKNPDGYTYTAAQCIEWPEWEAAGVGIWIMMADTEEEYAKLFKEPNFRNYWRPSFDKYLIPVKEILDDIIEDPKNE